MSNPADILLHSIGEKGHLNLIRHLGNYCVAFLFYISEGDIVLYILPLEWPFPNVITSDHMNS